MKPSALLPGAVLTLLTMAGCSQQTNRGAAELDRYGKEPSSFAASGVKVAEPEPPPPSNDLHALLVDSSFKLGWEEVPPPTLNDSNALLQVTEFVTRNGWEMEKGELRLVRQDEVAKTIRGLPWNGLRDRSFPAVTHGGILYVVLRTWKEECNGVAYNPNTNRFAESIAGFKPLGHHWYAWMQSGTPGATVRAYEGQVR